MGAFDGFDLSLSGMDAQMRRLRIISSNLANADSTRTADGGPYRRKDVVFAAQPLHRAGADFEQRRSGVQKVTTLSVVEDPRPFKRVYMPSHPDADEQGFVNFPNVESFEEIVNMMDAIRSYEANLSAFNASKQMIKKALEIGR